MKTLKKEILDDIWQNILFIYCKHSASNSIIPRENDLCGTARFSLLVYRAALSFRLEREDYHHREAKRLSFAVHANQFKSLYMLVHSSLQ
jgi:hypothetical protein